MSAPFRHSLVILYPGHATLRVCMRNTVSQCRFSTQDPAQFLSTDTVTGIAVIVHTGTYELTLPVLIPQAPLGAGLPLPNSGLLSTHGFPGQCRCAPLTDPLNYSNPACKPSPELYRHPGTGS